MSTEMWIAVIAMLAAAVAGAAAGIALHFSRESARAATRSAKAAEQQTEIARRAERAAVRAALAAEEQTEIQRQTRVDTAQPYVWADLQPDDAQGSLVRLVVGNSGPTIATNVRVEIEPPLVSPLDGGRRTDAATSALAEGVRSLAPGRKHAWSVGMGWDLIKDDGPTYTFTVNADGPFGPVPTLTYVVDLSQWRETADMPGGSLHLLTQSVNKLAKEIVAVQNRQIAAADARERLVETRQRANEIVPDRHVLDASTLDSGIASQEVGVGPKRRARLTALPRAAQAIALAGR